MKSILEIANHYRSLQEGISRYEIGTLFQVAKSLTFQTSDNHIRNVASDLIFLGMTEEISINNALCIWTSRN